MRKKPGRTKFHATEERREQEFGAKKFAFKPGNISPIKE
jgi:hypothetical protein